MAIIKCNKCGKEISDRAVKCPYCGKVVIVSSDNQDDDNRTNNQNNISASNRKNPGTGNYEN